MAKDDFGDDLTGLPAAAAGAPPPRGRGREEPSIARETAGSWGDSPESLAGDPADRPSTFAGGDVEASVGPPVGVLGVAAVLVMVSLVLGVRPGSGFSTPLAGWFVGGVLATVCLALYFPADVARRTRSWYIGKAWAGSALKVLLALVLVAVVLNAWHLADWVARR